MKAKVILLLLLAVSAALCAQTPEYRVEKTKTDTFYLVSSETQYFLDGVKTVVEVWTPYVGKRALKERLEALELSQDGELERLDKLKQERDSVKVKLKQVRDGLDKNGGEKATGKSAEPSAPPPASNPPATNNRKRKKE